MIHNCQICSGNIKDVGRLWRIRVGDNILLACKICRGRLKNADKI